MLEGWRGGGVGEVEGGNLITLRSICQRGPTATQEEQGRMWGRPTGEASASMNNVRLVPGLSPAQTTEPTEHD